MLIYHYFLYYINKWLNSLLNIAVAVDEIIHLSPSWFYYFLILYTIFKSQFVCYTCDICYWNKTKGVFFKRKINVIILSQCVLSFSFSSFPWCWNREGGVLHCLLLLFYLSISCTYSLGIRSWKGRGEGSLCMAFLNQVTIFFSICIHHCSSSRIMIWSPLWKPPKHCWWRFHSRQIP